MPVYAAERDQIMPCESNLLMRYTSYLFVPSGNEIQIWFEISGTQTLDRIGVLQIEVQRSSDGENWTTVQTYKSSDYANMLATSTSDYDSYVTYYGEYGYYYRAKVSIYGQKGLTIYGKSIYTGIIYLSN